MDRPNRRRLLRIGIVMIVVSIVLFSLSVYLIDSNTAHENTVYIDPGTTYTLLKGHVDAGDDIDYSVILPTGAANSTHITAFLSFSSGGTAGYVNSTNTSSTSKVLVSPYTGNVSLVITNKGSSTIIVNAAVGIVSYGALLTIVFGIALLPSGIALMGIHYYSRIVERRKEKLLRGFR